MHAIIGVIWHRASLIPRLLHMRVRVACAFHGQGRPWCSRPSIQAPTRTPTSVDKTRLRTLRGHCACPKRARTGIARLYAAACAAAQAGPTGLRCSWWQAYGCAYNPKCHRASSFCWAFLHANAVGPKHPHQRKVSHAPCPLYGWCLLPSVLAACPWVITCDDQYHHSVALQLLLTGQNKSHMGSSSSTWSGVGFIFHNSASGSLPSPSLDGSTAANRNGNSCSSSVGVRS